MYPRHVAPDQNVTRRITLKPTLTNRPPDLIRRILLSYLIALIATYLALPIEWQTLDAVAPLSSLSPLRILVMTAILTATLSLLGRFVLSAPSERLLIALTFAILSAIVMRNNALSFPFLTVCLLIEGILILYAVRGWNGRESTQAALPPAPLWPKTTLFLVSISVFALLCLWGVSRVLSFSTPSYDFGIFAQMFHSMKVGGLPMTTLERDGLLSHFRVHVSPIYYLMLPFYILVPHPATLQVLQAAILVSSVIPLWLIGKHHGLTGGQRLLLCAALLLYPALAGGTGYDLHENCFLAPLILWLLLGIDRRRVWLTLLPALLTLAVKEDAAVYVAVIALWLLVRALLHPCRWNGVMGLILLVLSLGYFFLVTDYLATVGDGVMSNRYQNLMPDNNESLFSVAVFTLCHPMKVLFECVDPEKLTYIGLTLAPVLGLPLLTRRYERYLLLIPYILVNLMSDYVYQHNIFFQYSFGSLACLFYLIAVNLADLRVRVRLPALLCTLAACAVLFGTHIVPRVTDYTARCLEHREEHAQICDLLDTIPKDASVTAGTFMTTYLSSRDVLYDLGYADRQHLLSSDYVVIDLKHEGDMSPYATGGKPNGYPRLLSLLYSNGYQVYGSLDNQLIIFQKKIK